MSNGVIAFIPARGGSKGIPGKNIRDFCGKPLLAWSILQAKETPGIDAIYVSSDSDEILSIAEKFGAHPIRRPAEISGDTATTESAIAHTLGQLKGPQAVMLLQATSPLRKPGDLGRAIAEFEKGNCDSMFSAAVLEDFLIWEKEGDQYRSFNYDYRARGRRQDRKPQFVENGSFYLFKTELFQETGNRLGGRIGMVTQELWQSFELDSWEDWGFVETLFQFHLAPKRF